MKVDKVILTYKVYPISAELDIDKKMLVPKDDNTTKISFNLYIFVDKKETAGCSIGVFHFDDFCSIEDTLNKVDIIKDICNSKKSALLHQKHKDEGVRKFAQLRINHFPEEDIEFRKHPKEGLVPSYYENDYDDLPF